MTDCSFCHKPILKKQETGIYDDQHKVCWLEWNERIRLGDCDRCGKIFATEGRKCSACYNNDSDYSGFEGPSP